MWQLVEAIRRDHPEVPVILMTAQASLQSAVQAVNQGAFYYLQKPFKPDLLVRSVRQRLDGRPVASAKRLTVHFRLDGS